MVPAGYAPGELLPSSIGSALPADWRRSKTSRTAMEPSPMAAAALDRAAADVSDGQDPRPAGLQEQRSRGVAGEPGYGNVGAGEQEPVAIRGELAGQPVTERHGMQPLRCNIVADRTATM